MSAWYLGLDIGSTASKCIVIDDGGTIRGKGVFPSGAGTKGPQAVVDAALSEAGISIDEVTASCTTGYGRNLVDWSDQVVSELSCHAKGASALFTGVHTVIDIGGQDAKVLSVTDEGTLDNFVMNDKCAAGTGRFLDVMASVFGCKVSDLAGYDSQATHVAPISSTCTVFAESEVISKLAAGTPIPDIVAGIHMSVVDRTYGLVKRLGIRPDVAMTGGVALNEGLRRRMEQRIGLPIRTSELSQLNGALGAALIARERAGRASS
jgi:predicted CoA-substrate-specific enzyme activase